MKSMKWLLKEYEYTSEADYYDMVLTSYINGQMEQAKRQFLQMRKCDRVKFLTYLVNEYIYSVNNEVSSDKRERVIFFIKQIYEKQ